MMSNVDKPGDRCIIMYKSFFGQLKISDYMVQSVVGLLWKIRESDLQKVLMSKTGTYTIYDIRVQHVSNDAW